MEIIQTNGTAESGSMAGGGNRHYVSNRAVSKNCDADESDNPATPCRMAASVSESTRRG